MTDQRIRIRAGDISYLDMDDSTSAPHNMEVNAGGNNLDFKIRGQSDNPLFKTDASTDRIGTNGRGTPLADFHIGGNLWVDTHITASENISSSGDIYGNRLYAQGSTSPMVNLKRTDGDNVNAVIQFENGNGSMFAGVDGDVQNAGANIFGVGYAGDLIDNDGSNHATFVVTGSQVVINNATTASGDAALTVGGHVAIESTKKLYLNKTEDTYLDSDSTDRLRFVAGGQQMLVLDYDTGNRAAFGDTKVGIGAGDNHLPSHELEVDGVISASGNITSADGFTTSGNTITTGSITVGDLHHGAYISGSNGNIELSGSGTGLLIVEGDISASGTIYGAVFVSQSIGGDIIANTLRVNTDIVATNMEVTVEGDISASGDLYLGGSGQKIHFMSGSAKYDYINNSNSAITFGSGSTDVVKFNLVEQKVGIGTTSPSTALEVEGSISASGDFILRGDGAEPFLSSSNGSLELSGSGFGQLQVDYRLFDTGSSTVASAGGGMGDIVKFGGSTTTAGQIYYLQAAGTWAQTDADAGETTSGSLALALGTNSTSHGMLLRGVGKLDSDPAGAIGAPIYLSTTAGRCTSIPQSSGDFSRVIGFNLDEDGLIYFNPDNTTIKVA
jgi:hypothetical protein